MFTEITMEDALRIRGEEAWEDGIEAGKKEGMRQGLEVGSKTERDRINELNRRLIRDGRSDELIQAIDNPKLQEQLLEEYGL